MRTLDIGTEASEHPERGVNEEIHDLVEDSSLTLTQNLLYLLHDQSDGSKHLQVDLDGRKLVTWLRRDWHRIHQSCRKNIHPVNNLHMTLQFLPHYCSEITLVTLIVSIPVNSFHMILQFLPRHIDNLHPLNSLQKILQLLPLYQKVGKVLKHNCKPEL